MWRLGDKNVCVSEIYITLIPKDHQNRFFSAMFHGTDGNLDFIFLKIQILNKLFCFVAFILVIHVHYSAKSILFHHSAFL